MGATNPGLSVFQNHPPDPSKGIGRVFWLGNSATPVPGGVTGVDSVGAYGDRAQAPFATLDYAVTQCVAGRNDIIYNLPGHAETIATATALDIDVAGVTIIGLGVGSNRPTYTVATAATATITFSAANTRTENIVVICNLDGLNSAITVTGADVFLDIEYRDTSATVEADIAITASGARFICNLRDIGFTTGDQREASISMNGVVGARINIDQYGIPATAVVNFVTTLCSDVEVRGTTYVSGTTDGSKNVVDTITGSLWYMDVIDAAAGARYTGGSAATVASDDISAINTVLGTIASAAATGAVTSTDVAMAYLKQIITMLGPTELDTDTLGEILVGTAGVTTFPAASAPANSVALADVLRAIYNCVSADSAASDVTVQTPYGKRVTKVGDVASAPDDLFTVTGKCVITLMVGEVTSVIATTTSIQLITSTGGIAVTAVTDIVSDAAGTLYLVTGDPDDTLNGDVTTIPNVDIAWSQTGFHAPFMINDDRIYMSVGGAGTGTIQWDLFYIPLEASASVASSA